MDSAPSAGTTRTPSGPVGPRPVSTSPNASHSHAAYQAKLPNGYAHPPFGTSLSYTNSPAAERRSMDHSPHKFSAINEIGSYNDSVDATSAASPSTITLRKLPSTMNNEALVSMLLFAEDFLDARFVATDALEDTGFQTAVARFRTFEGGIEARNRLNGRLNATNDANMIVEIHQSSTTKAPTTWRRTSDGQSGRQLSTSASSGASGSSNSTGVRQPSRYSGTFQSLDKISPTKFSHTSVIGDGRGADTATSPPQNVFSPQSPIAPSIGTERPRVSGKSVINDDVVDDETGELLRDPLAFAKSGHVGSGHRQNPNQHVPVSRLASLHINTDQQTTADGVPIIPGFSSARTLKPLQSPVSEFSPNGMAPMSPSSMFSVSPQFQRTHYPPANPADQNPPCNTLYVGNLPVDASEDELKALFSKQRGYKRLCFRTKHNGPMCFVEFEDITFATKALNELYGTMLHNSVKGGIRLSFSKNPLGVRAGQSNGLGPTSPLASPGGGYSNSVGVPPGFATANGPPPGLTMPPGLASPTSTGGMSSLPHPGNPKFFIPGSNPLSGGSSHNPVRSQTIGHSYGMQSPNGNHFPDYMMGR